MTGETKKVLRRLAEGGRIEARRVFPFPHTFRLLAADDATEGSDVGLSTIDHLVNGGFVRIATADRHHDRFSYVISDSGCQAAKAGTKPAEDGRIVIPGTEHLLAEKPRRTRRP